MSFRWSAEVGKTHVASWIPAVDSEQSRCTVHYNMCAPHLGGTLTVISIGADAVFPGPTAHLEASWRKSVSAGCQSHPLLGSSAASCWVWPLYCICHLTSVSVSAPKRSTHTHVRVPRTKKCAAESKPAAFVAHSSWGTNIPTIIHAEELFLIRRQWFSSFPVLLWSAGLTEDAGSVKGGWRNRWLYTLKSREKCRSERRFGIEWGKKVSPLHTSKHTGKIWQEKLWSSICCRGKSSQIQTKALVQAQENAAISRDETLAGDPAVLHSWMLQRWEDF